MISSNADKALYQAKAQDSVTPTAEFSLVFYTAIKDGNKEVQGVTQHTIEDGKMGIGKYVSTDDVKNLFSENLPNSLTLKPDNLIAENANTLVWHTPVAKRDMWFRVHGSEPERMSVKWCRLLFIAKKTGRLSVFAVMDRKLTEKSKVYHAPLMNIGSNGDVCQGSARLPKNISIHTMGEVENSIFDSNFSHINHKFTLSPTVKKNSDSPEISDRDLMAFWRKKEKSGETVKRKELVEVGTLQSVLSRFT